MSTLPPEAEGCAEVDAVLKKIVPDEDRRPTIFFYDTAYLFDRYLSRRGDLSWVATMLIVQYWGRKGLLCSLFNSPNDDDNPLLWNVQEAPPEFYWNSSMGESNNGWLSGSPRETEEEEGHTARWWTGAPWGVRLESQGEPGGVTPQGTYPRLWALALGTAAASAVE
ncbi:unnamed protein product [Ectocarpus sp. CCAP 1310/34]|nr:unnamed protein product [Ectocarpus sp. CCAP 1310/34]